MPATTQEKIIPDFIKLAIEKEINTIVQEELENAKEHIEKRKAEAVAKVMLNVEKYMSLERIGDTYKFIIEIK